MYFTHSRALVHLHHIRMKENKSTFMFYSILIWNSIGGDVGLFRDRFIKLAVGSIGHSTGSQADHKQIYIYTIYKKVSY